MGTVRQDLIYNLQWYGHAAAADNVREMPVTTQRRQTSFHLDQESYDTYNIAYVPSLLASAFDWASSPQEYNYWSDVYESLYNEPIITNMPTSIRKVI